jgi:parallel beta-helix repeat protein
MGQITLSSHVVLQASGATIVATDSYLLKSSNSDITIDGGTWNGRGDTTAVILLKGSNCTVKNCTVKNSDGAAIRIENAKNITCKSVKATGSDTGIRVKKSKNVTLTDCTVNKNRIGFVFDNTTGENYVNNGVADNNSFAGLQILGSSTKLTYSGGSCSNSKSNGITQTRGSYLILKDVDVSNNDLNGISPVGNDVAGTRLDAYDCSFNNNGRHGVAGTDDVEIYLENCTANGNTRQGIFMNKNCTSPNGIIGCTVKNNNESGILIEGGSTCTKIKDTVASGNKKYGINLVDVSTTLTNCTVKNNRKYGLYIHGSKSKTVKVNKSTISSNKQDGVRVEDSKKVKVTNCTISSNTQSGIVAKGKSLEVCGGTVSSNGTYGLDCEKGTMTISDATVKENSDIGVYFTGTSTSGSCTDSTITNNKSGIVLKKGAVVSEVSENKITGNSDYGIAVYKNSNGRKTKLTECQNNTLSNSSATKEILCQSGATVPSKLKSLEVIKLNSSVKVGATEVSGTSTASTTVSIQVGSTSDSVKAGKDKKFSLSTDELTSGMKLSLYVKDSCGNAVTKNKTL